MKRIKSLCAMLFFAVSISAQFHTVQRTGNSGRMVLETSSEKKEFLAENLSDRQLEPLREEFEYNSDRSKFREARRLPERNKKSTKASIVSKRKTARVAPLAHDLNIYSLLAEIGQHGIQHPKIVLAQAILETGWFTSAVCRNKNNLFGLTNPRTGQYYEFDHWRDSVRAYRDKVQYKYKGGNYLLWLQEIGYAEDPRYISSLAQIIRTYML